MTTMLETIRERRSIRTFDGTPITEEERAALGDKARELRGPFGADIKFRMLDAEVYGLESRVIVGADLYVAAKVERGPYAELTCGYCFERFCLEAWRMGIGSVMLAASINRPAFEAAMEVSEGWVMPVASPLGHASEKRSLRERAMRRGLKADERKPFGDLFFDGAFERPLAPERAGAFADGLEAVRLAPSAANKQPWRVVVADSAAHLYESRTINPSPLGDVQRVDLGIALAHLDLVMSEQGTPGAMVVKDPQLEGQGELLYVASYQLG